ncbi:hypothetical protein CYFUS_007211 [Cystobacter fuscus]|uniref:Galactose oxidase n=1 Tax=Cystobacter fuscus TaxID=43 RepID=A0A250JEC3_9BACT|nr:hypothetical protein [Cystobacter fuscus]ATB41741.1 hypothetical protein CYFUS_007211 [Cystobacter fuscus]
MAGAALASGAELYDPDTNTWTLLPDAQVPASTAATLLHTGQVLLTGDTTSRYTP